MLPRPSATTSFVVALAVVIASARDRPLGAGMALAAIGGLMLFLDQGLMSEPIGWAMLLSPFPGSVLLIIAGWRAGHGGRTTISLLGQAR